MHAWSMMKTARSQQRTFSPSLIFALAVIPALAPNLARAADPALAPPSATYAIPATAAASAIYAASVTAANSATPAPPLTLAHLDEQSVPSAENPGNSTTGSTAAPGDNSGPSDDWEQVPPVAAPEPASNPADGVSPAAPAQGSSPGSPAPPPKGQPTRPSEAEPNPDKAIAPAPTNVASAPAGEAVHPASLTKTPNPPAQSRSAPVAAGSNDGSATDTNGSGTEALSDSSGNPAVSDANAGPPPALDLGSIQSGPDLAEAPLDGEIKKADTPALMAALRVTEQARVELQAGQTADAIRDLGRAVSIDPGSPFEYFYLGRAYIARRNYTQALTFLQRAEIGFASRPDWLGADVGFEGNCYEELGQNSEAELAYQRALGTAPNNVTARVGYTRLAAYLPSPPVPAANEDATADSDPAHEASGAPRDDAAEPAPAQDAAAGAQDASAGVKDDAAQPAPAEPPAPPPPATNAAADSGPKQSTAWDYPPD
jgi:hypothetical protein